MAAKLYFIFCTLNNVHTFKLQTFHVGLSRFRGFHFDFLHLVQFVYFAIQYTAIFTSGIFLDYIQYARFRI